MLELLPAAVPSQSSADAAVTGCGISPSAGTRRTRDRVRGAEAQQLIEERRWRALGVKLENGKWLVHPDATDGPVPKRTTFLSPFDRLIHDRERAEALFDFYYRLEMYVPKAKREYGYYVLPILAAIAS